MATSPSEAPRDDTALGRAIAKVTDADLRKVLAREVELLKDSRKFGLVFDRHLPESARLPTHPIRVGLSVVRRDEIVDLPRAVLELVGDPPVANLDDGTQEPVDELVVFRDFGDVVHPGLRSVERIERGPKDAPWHTVINGENLHALQMLRQTHAGLIDLIYIDPPYNTGNEGWIYDDKYVDSNDRSKSSKWLSFMERRLTIARSLLKPTGVIIVAIGDDEHHRLRMLMDQVFGVSNFLANVTWQGSTKSDLQFGGGGVDYMVFYARDEDTLVDVGVRWRETKSGAADALAAADEIFAQCSSDAVEATTIYRKWLRENRDRLGRGVAEYSNIDSHGQPFRGDNMGSPTPRPNLRYAVLHPDTGKPVKMPKNGWQFALPLMNERIAAGEILFGPDETTIPSRKRLLSRTLDIEPAMAFTQSRLTASKRLDSVLGERRFPYPKDHEILMRWIGMVAPKDAVVLDFFGGSGTTTEAVMRLNAEDQGTRQSILVTNNEVGAGRAKQLRKDGDHPGDDEWEQFGVFEYVTRPRVSTVVTGERPDGSTYSEGIDANVEFLELTYLDPGDVRRGREFTAIAPILWLDAGATGAVIDKEPKSGWALAEAYGVLFDIDALKPFAEAVTERAKADDLPGLIFVLTDSPTELRVVIERLPVGCRVRRLYESYVERFALGVEGSEA